MSTDNSDISVSRLKKEYQKLSKSPPAGVAVSLPSDTDMYVWEALLNGPDDSVYKGSCIQSLVVTPIFALFVGGVFKARVCVPYPNFTY